jgi:cytochrome b561
MTTFSGLQRVLHWLMAVMVLAMLFIGVSMVSTLKPAFLTLISIHKPLGIAILVLALLRLGVRWRLGAPPLPDDLPRVQAFAAKLSHIALYALLIVMPLIGWGLLSAGGYPIVLYGPLHLPQILPHDDQLHAILLTTHITLAYTFFVLILLHVAAALSHALIRRDGIFGAMAGIGPRNHGNFVQEPARAVASQCSFTGGPVRRDNAGENSATRAGTQRRVSQTLRAPDPDH